MIQIYIGHHKIGKTTEYQYIESKMFASNPSKDKMVVPQMFNTLYSIWRA